MSFYVPRRYAQTTMPAPLPQQRNTYRPMDTGSEVQTQVNPPSNPLNDAVNAGLNGYGIVKGGRGMYNDAMRMYDRMFTPSGVNPESVMAGSGAAEAAALDAAANPLLGGVQTPWLNSAVISSGGTPLAAGATPAASGAGAAGAGAAGTGSVLAAGAANPLAGAGAAGTGSVLATGSGAASGAAGAAETGMLAGLGPVGVAAGLGLLATKLFKLW